MTSPKRNGQAPTPPYLSISKLGQLLNLVSTRRFDEIQPQDLVHYGFGETDSYIGVTALRFLGLIDQKNQAKETIKKLQLQGDAKIEALATTVRNAYAMIFERIQDPAALDPDELHNEFLITYGITPRVARAAVPAFVWLCEQANLRTPSGPKQAVKSQPSQSNSQRVRRSTGAQPRPNTGDGSDTLAFAFKGGITLIIPNSGPELTIALAQGELKQVSDEIIKFAEKYLPETEVNK
jgi:hypothetical protein